MGIFSNANWGRAISSAGSGIADIILLKEQEKREKEALEQQRLAAEAKAKLEFEKMSYERDKDDKARSASAMDDYNAVLRLQGEKPTTPDLFDDYLGQWAALEKAYPDVYKQGELTTPFLEKFGIYSKDKIEGGVKAAVSDGSEAMDASAASPKQTGLSAPFSQVVASAGHAKKTANKIFGVPLWRQFKYANEKDFWNSADGAGIYTDILGTLMKHLGTTKNAMNARDAATAKLMTKLDILEKYDGMLSEPQFNELAASTFDIIDRTNNEVEETAKAAQAEFDLLNAGPEYKEKRITNIIAAGSKMFPKPVPGPLGAFEFPEQAQKYAENIANVEKYTRNLVAKSPQVLAKHDDNALALSVYAAVMNGGIGSDDIEVSASSGEKVDPDIARVAIGFKQKNVIPAGNDLVTGQMVYAIPLSIPDTVRNPAFKPTGVVDPFSQTEYMLIDKEGAKIQAAALEAVAAAERGELAFTTGSKTADEGLKRAAEVSGEPGVPAAPKKPNESYAKLREKMSMIGGAISKVDKGVQDWKATKFSGEAAGDAAYAETKKSSKDSFGSTIMESPGDPRESLRGKPQLPESYDDVRRFATTIFGIVD